MRSFSRRLTAEPSAIAKVRRDLVAWAQVTDDHIREDLSLAVSEVVTNSVRHGPAGGQITVQARAEETRVRVAVRDAGTGARVAVRPADTHGGRGLRLLDAICESWGVTSDPTCVWFTIRTAD